MRLPPLIVVLAALACAACQGASASGPPGPAPGKPAEGKMCGGIAGIACGAGQYCQIPQGQCRVVADVSGVCRSKPQICTMIYAPVCGCDGKTYSNSCAAAAAGTSVAAQGACKAPGG